jgi:hypothetical protein
VAELLFVILAASLASALLQAKDRLALPVKGR